MSFCNSQGISYDHVVLQTRTPQTYSLRVLKQWTTNTTHSVFSKLTPEKKKGEKYSQLQLTIINKYLLGTVQCLSYCSDIFLFNISNLHCYIQTFCFLNVLLLLYQKSHYSFFHKIKLRPSACFVAEIKFKNEKCVIKGLFKNRTCPILKCSMYFSSLNNDHVFSSHWDKLCFYFFFSDFCSWAMKC